jgi:hypothetical protein
MAEKLGVGCCPICNADNARVSLSKSHYAVLTCSGCNAQVFARGPKSDELLRDRIKVEKPAPVAVLPAPTIPDPVPVPVPEEPAPKKKAGSFLEMFGGEA